MSQKDFLTKLQKQYQFKIKQYGDKQINIEINPNKEHWYFLIPYSKRSLMNSIYLNKEGEPFTITKYNYTIKDNQTGEISHAYIAKSRVLFTTIYQRDLIILNPKDEYDKKLAIILSQYQILKPKRVPLFYRTNMETFLTDMR